MRSLSRYTPADIAQVVKLVDTLASGASALRGVEVQVLFWAPIQKKADSKESAFFRSISTINPSAKCGSETADPVRCAAAIVNLEAT